MTNWLIGKNKDSWSRLQRCITMKIGHKNKLRKSLAYHVRLYRNYFIQIDLVIGVASGKEKEQAIRAALKGDLIDVLVTDDETAETLLFRK